MVPVLVGGKLATTSTVRTSFTSIWVGILRSKKDETKQGILNERKELTGSSTYVFVLGHSVVDPEWLSPDPTVQVVSDPNPDPNATRVPFKPGQINDWRDL